MLNQRIKIPCVIMRGGTSRGPFFLATDLPTDVNERDRLLLKIMGRPEFKRVDGIAGMDTVTSKLAIISRSSRPDADVDYLFCQADTKSSRLDFNANCGNLVSAVAPFAIDEGLIRASQDETIVRIFNVNTGIVIHGVVQTPGGRVCYEGDCTIDGAPGAGPPIHLNFLDSVGAKTGKLFPSGQMSEEISGVEVSCLDVAVPVVFIQAHSLNLTGQESAVELSENLELLAKLETIRLEAGFRMGLGDCRGSVIPKVCLVSPPAHGGTVTSRYFTPAQCHPSHAVTGALCLAVASSLRETVVGKMLKELVSHCGERIVTVEHPSGKIAAGLKLSGEGTAVQVERAAFVRTAERIFEGRVIVPADHISPAMHTQEFAHAHA